DQPGPLVRSDEVIRVGLPASRRADERPDVLDVQQHARVEAIAGERPASHAIGRLQRGARGADQLVQLVADGRLVPAQAVHHRVVGRPVRRRLRVGEQAVAEQVHPGTPAGYQGQTRDDGHDRNGLVHWPTFGSDTGTTGDGSAFHAGREGRATSPRHSTATLVPLSGSSAAVSGRPASSKNISVRVWAPSANSSTGDRGPTVFTRYGTA